MEEVAESIHYVAAGLNTEMSKGVFEIRELLKADVPYVKAIKGPEMDAYVGAIVL